MDARKILFLSLVLALSTPSVRAGDEPLKPAIEVTPKKNYFVGGGGVKHLGSQLAFPFRHPMKFGNNLSHPFRHPVVAFSQYSNWVDDHNLVPGLEAAAAVSGIAGSAGIFGLYGKSFGSTTTVVK
jgi:hypothetical protein